jgi:hypothetical protein
MSTPYDTPSDPAKRQSAALTDGPDRAGARSMLKATGFTDEANFIARPFPPVNEEFPLQQATFYGPGAPRTFMIGTHVKF